MSISISAYVSRYQVGRHLGVINLPYSIYIHPLIVYTHPISYHQTPITRSTKTTSSEGKKTLDPIRSNSIPFHLINTTQCHGCKTNCISSKLLNTRSMNSTQLNFQQTEPNVTRKRNKILTRPSFIIKNLFLISYHHPSPILSYPTLPYHRKETPVQPLGR